MEIIESNIRNGNFIFGIFALVTIAGAFYVLITKNVLFAAFGLLVSLLGVAGLYVLAGAEFLAGAQIMIYIGGILVLIIFGIMLSSSSMDGLKVESIDIMLSTFIFIVILAAELLLFSKTTFISKPISHHPDLKKIGMNLMTVNILPLEIIGLLLLVSLIGATFIAKKDE